MKKWTRRDFLRNSTIAGLLAPVAAYWHDLPEARALTGRKHMCLIFIPNGKCRENVYVERSGGSYTFGPGYAPYEAFREDAIVFEEYSFAHFIDEHYSGDHAGHFAGANAMFTAEVPYVSGDRGTASMAPSIDQIVAWDLLNRGEIASPLRKSLNIKMRGSSFKAPTVFWQTPPDYALGRTYSSEMLPVSQHETPRDGFIQMFGDLAGMDGGASAEELWAQGRSVLDVPAAEMERLRSQLPAEGNALVDQHLHSLRELERGLAADDGEIPFEVPEMPPEMSTDPSNHEAVWQKWVEVIDAAFRLDRTRVVAIQLGGCASRFQVPSLGLGFVGESGDSNSGSDHHSYTHWDAGNVDLFLEWYSERVVELVAELKGVGTTPKSDILCDSLVMVGAEFGHNHRAYDVPVALFGQAGGFLQTGQLVTCGNDLSQFHKHTGTLLTACHAMGVTDLDRVGRDLPEYQRGPVPELLA